MTSTGKKVDDDCDSATDDDVSCASAHLQSQDLLPDQKLVVEFLKNSSEGDSGSPSAASQTSVATNQSDGQFGQHKFSEIDC